MSPGPLEIGGILLLFVLLFGAKKLPDLGSSVGKSIKNFKKGIAEGGEDKDVAHDARPATEASVPPSTQTSRDVS